MSKLPVLVPLYTATTPSATTVGVCDNGWTWHVKCFEWSEDHKGAYYVMMKFIVKRPFMMYCVILMIVRARDTTCMWYLITSTKSSITLSGSCGSCSSSVILLVVHSGGTFQSKATKYSFNHSPSFSHPSSSSPPHPLLLSFFFCSLSSCLCLALQHHGIVRLGGVGDWEVCQRVLQWDQSLHHVRGAALCRPHPQTLHRHLLGTYLKTLLTQ